MNGCRAALLATALVLHPGMAEAQASIGGIAVGTPIATVCAILGAPVDVASLDSGHRFAFNGAAAYVDDDGIVLAVDAQTGIPRIEIDGREKRFPIGSYSLARADAELADVAEYAAYNVRSYRLAPRRDLVLAFASPANRLARVAYGEPGQLARLGLLPGDPAAKAVPYRAPIASAAAPSGATGATHSTVYRLAVDRGGTIAHVDIIVPSLSPRSDDEFARRLQTERYLPATLGGRAIAATVFIEVRH